jgi:hypothetical protein
LAKKEMSMKTVGIILIILGVLGFVYKGITYTTKETVVDAGPLEIQAEEEKTVPIPEILSGIAIIGGIVMVMAGSKKR